MIALAVFLALTASLIGSVAIGAYTYLRALERRTQHAPVAELQERLEALDLRIKKQEFQSVTGRR